MRIDLILELIGFVVLYCEVVRFLPLNMWCLSVSVDVSYLFNLINILFVILVHMHLSDCLIKFFY